MVEGNHRLAWVVKDQVGGSVAARSITKIFPLEVNEGNQNITAVLHGKVEWTVEVYVIDILQDEKQLGKQWKNNLGNNSYWRKNNL